MSGALRAAAVAVALVLALVLGARSLGGFVPAELALYDQLVRWRSAAQAASGQVVLVGATEADLQRFGWPLSDERLAQLLEAILAQRPRAVGIDLYRDLPVPPGTERLVDVLEKNDTLIGVTKVGDARSATIPAAAALRGTRRVGFADMVIDPGGSVRRGLLYLESGGKNLPGFSLLLALKYLEPLGVRPGADAETGAMRLGKAVIPPLEPDDGGYVDADAAGYQFLLDYAGGPAPFARHSAGEVLERRIGADALRDKIVLVGVTAESVKDYFQTPFQHGAQSGEIFGIEMQARTADQLLRLAAGHAPVMRTSANWIEGFCIALFTLAGAGAASLVRQPGRLALVLTAGLAIIGAASYASFQAYAWLPAVSQAVGWLLSAGFVTSYLSWREHQQRGELMELFSRHVSEEIAEEIWSRRHEVLAADGTPRRQRLTATVLFSDIKGFTTVSEQLEPQQLMEWLNQYMGAMTALVRRHHGTVDKLIGDAVMAVFGIPVPRGTEAEIRQDAVNAVECALAMRASLAQINRDNAARGLPGIEIRVGIQTGSLVAGSLGSRDRLQYTVIGDTVNTASRLESWKTSDGSPAPESTGCRVLVGEETLRQIGSHYVVAAVGEVRLKGKERAVRVYSVLGPADPSRAPGEKKS